MEPLDNPLITELSTLIKNKPDGVAFFVGAGLSRPLFPSWQKILQAMINEVHALGKLNFSKDELLEMAGKGENLLEIADMCADAMGSAGYRSFLEKKFDFDFRDSDIPLAYTELFSMAPHLVLTTNYDRIPDRAGGGAVRTYTNRNVPEFLRAIGSGKRAIFKIHGDIGDQESIVLTTSEFQSLIYKNESARNALKAVFSTRTVVFVGFGMTDPHIDLVLQLLKSESEGRQLTHYAIMPVESRFKTEAIERKYGIRVIGYRPSSDLHPEVTDIIKKLRIAHAGAVQPTAEFGADEWMSRLGESIRNNLGYTNYCFSEDGKTICMTVDSIAKTPIERQKEILAIVDCAGLFRVKNRVLRVFLCEKTGPTASIPEHWPIRLSFMVSTDMARKYSLRSIEERELWSSLTFTNARAGMIDFGHVFLATVPYIGVK